MNEDRIALCLRACRGVPDKELAEFVESVKDSPYPEDRLALVTEDMWNEVTAQAAAVVFPDESWNVCLRDELKNVLDLLEGNAREYLSYSGDADELIARIERVLDMEPQR